MGVNRKAKAVIAALTRKGAVRENKHHVMLKLQVGKSTVVTRVSHGKGELDSYLIGQMAKDCLLSTEEFLRLVDCSMDETTWRKRVRERRSQL